jgi:hypothetical protein
VHGSLPIIILASSARLFCNSAIAAAAGREASAKQIGKAMFPLTWIKVSTAFLCSHKLQKTIGGLP